MAIAAKVSSAELTAQVINRFVDQIFEIRLINSPGVSYTPGVTVDSTFLSNEVVYGTGGYVRQTFKFVSADVAGYSDDGIGLARKAAVFTHNGSGTNTTFSHAVMCRGSGNVLTLGSVSSAPPSGVNGNYTNIPTVTTGSGKGLTVNLAVTNSGASTSNWVVAVNNFGYSYAPGDSINISAATLNQIGATVAGVNNLVFTVGTVTSGSTQIVAVAQTTSTINLGGGNQAVLYFDLKQFGYYSI